MSCQLYQEELSVYLDGELPAARVARLEAHLRVCPHCQGELNELSGISSYIRSASHELRVSQEFDQRVLRAVGYFQVAHRQVQPRSYLRPLLALAITLLALLGLVQHFLSERPPLGPPLPSPESARASVSPVAPVAPFANGEQK